MSGRVHVGSVVYINPIDQYGPDQTCCAEPLGRSKPGFIGQPNEEVCTSHCQVQFWVSGLVNLMLFIFFYILLYKKRSIGGFSINIHFYNNIKLSGSDLDLTHQRPPNRERHHMIQIYLI